ncbi:hypothetical protein J2768_000915 [Agrobacterium tumefaciens]|uniref:hypothetical protein n=1 Tax=Agrobacterium tumefaciens TaxID=358 RepID=UPI000DD53424|nr:hypothetical protein [Agrobacterium tumefaciens]MBP2538517.1 hypothetical protein [Agrobacterium tumefaciens]
MVFEQSEEIQDQLLDFIDRDASLEPDIMAGNILGQFLSESVQTGQKIVQLIVRAADYNLAIGFLSSFGLQMDVESLPADLGVTCFWNKYHALSSEPLLKDIAPVQKEFHSLNEQHSDVAVLVTSGLIEPAAVSGNLRRVRERFGPRDLLVVTPTATYDEIETLDHYLREDRIYDARLLLAVEPSYRDRVRLRLKERQSHDIPGDTYRYPGDLDQLRERYIQYRVGRLTQGIQF